MLTDIAGSPPAPRSPADLVTAQLAAIDAWHRARRQSEAAAENVAMTCEMRLDVSRRVEARRREQAALVARAAEHLRQSGGARRTCAAPRAVLAHRNDWLRSKVEARLRESGVDVVGSFGDGADAAGAIVVEQPEVVLIEDRLPTLPGTDLVRRIRAFSPGTVVGVHVLDGEGVGPFMEAGAQAVFTRRVPPEEIADELLSCFKADGRAVSVV